MLNFITTFVHFLSKDLFRSARSTALAWLPRFRLAVLSFGLNFDVFICEAGLGRYLRPRSRWPGRNIFDKVASLSLNSGQNGIIFVVCVLPLKSVRISSISKVTIIHKSTTVAIDTSLTSTVFALFLEFYLGRLGWNSSLNGPQKSSR